MAAGFGHVLSPFRFSVPRITLAMMDDLIHVLCLALECASLLKNRQPTGKKGSHETQVPKPVRAVVTQGTP